MSNNRNISGGAELDAFLQQVSAKVEKNIMRSALRAGANVFKDAAKARVPVELGALRRSIRVNTGYKKGRVSASVKAGNKKAWYWQFVEFGTAPHVIEAKRASALAFGGTVTQRVQHPGARPHPFLPTGNGRAGGRCDSCHRHPDPQALDRGRAERSGVGGQMKIRIAISKPGSLDGVNVIDLVAGVEYETVDSPRGDRLAQYHIRRGDAVEVLRDDADINVAAAAVAVAPPPRLNLKPKGSGK